MLLNPGLHFWLGEVVEGGMATLGGPVIFWGSLFSEFNCGHNVLTILLHLYFYCKFTVGFQQALLQLSTAIAFPALICNYLSSAFHHIFIPSFIRKPDNESCYSYPSIPARMKTRRKVMRVVYKSDDEEKHSWKNEVNECCWNERPRKDDSH